MLKHFLALLFIASPLFASITPPVAPELTAPADAIRAADGLATKVLAAGQGKEHPGPDDLVRMSFTVWKSNGAVVQHIPAPQTLVLPVAKMLPGWGEAVQLMVEGEKRRAWVPASLGGGKIEPDTSMVVDTELVEIVKHPTAPPDVAAAPADAKKTGSGLAYKVLRAGTGTTHPKRSNTVSVHYTGWTTDGKMFDSSVIRGTPAQFPLTRVIKGWTEGLQLMVTGEKTRFWIPANLAYGNSQPGVPHGMLVFDIELLEIK